jgi:hypothetical protein
MSLDVPLTRSASSLCFVPRAGWGTNEKLIIDILAHRDAAQRRAIRAAYAETYGEELLRALNDEIHGKFEVIMTPKPRAHRDPDLRLCLSV